MHLGELRFDKSDAPRDLRYVLQESALYLVPLLLFVAIKTFAKTPCTGDENIYFYVGRRIAEGLFPYSEVFNAHPPGHLLIAALFMAPGWYEPFIFKFIPTLPACGTLLLSTFLLRDLGFTRIYTAITALLIAFSLNFMMVSSHFTGANWSLFILFGALCALWRERRVLAGVLLACAGLISFHLIPALGAVAIADAYFTRKAGLWRAIRTGFVLGATTLGVHLLFYILAGEPYFEQVFGYHLHKTPMGDPGVATTMRFFYDEYHLCALALLGFAALLVSGSTRAASDGRPRRQESFIWLVLFTAAMQVLAILTAKRVFTYYLIPLVPLFAVIGVYGLYWFVTQARLFVKAWKDDAPFGGLLGLLAGVLLIFVATCAWGESLETRLDYYKKDFGEVSRYAFEPSPLLPAFVNEAIRATIFSPERRIGDYYPSVTRYLWHEIATDTPEKLLPALLQYKDVPGKIFGDSSNTGYFALLSGRKVSLEMADTNSQIFRSGLMDMTDLIKRLERDDPPVFVVANPKRGIGSNSEFVAYLNAKFELVKTAFLGSKTKLQLYKRKS